MKMSTRGRYGLRAMIELAKLGNGKPIMMETIAESQGLSRKYLHAILNRLRLAGFVSSVRGAGGGFRLARPPEEIRLDEMIEALEGTLSVIECAEDPASCRWSRTCRARKVWMGVGEAMRGYLAAMTLSDLVNGRAIQ